MISILMSTYNGEKFVEEQIESILNQTIGKDKIKLYIRDDGSKDDTKNIIKKYEKENSNIYVIEGQNIGTALSFFSLIKHVPLGNEYYAFADQDDFWFESKIENALNSIGKNKNPTLYYSNATFADEECKSFNIPVIEKENLLSIPTIMAGMPALGCTMVFNEKLLLYLKKVNLTGIEMHDRTTLLIAYLLGEVYYDEKSNMLYRQHSNNVIGNFNNNNYQKYKKKFKQSYKLWFKRKKFDSVVQSYDMLQNYKNKLNIEDENYLKMFLNYRKSIKTKKQLIKEPKISTLNKGTKRSYILRVLLNIF